MLFVPYSFMVKAVGTFEIRSLTTIKVLFDELAALSGEKDKLYLMFLLLRQYFSFNIGSFNN